MASVRQELLDYFATQWGTTTRISYQSFNATFDPNSSGVSGYDDNDVFVVPVIDHLETISPEFPILSSFDRERYSLGINILIPKLFGDSAGQTHADSLKTIFHKKNISTTTYTYLFGPFEIKKGFLASDGSRFEIPCISSFEVYVT